MLLRNTKISFAIYFNYLEVSFKSNYSKYDIYIYIILEAYRYKLGPQEHISDPISLYTYQCELLLMKTSFFFHWGLQNSKSGANM